MAPRSYLLGVDRRTPLFTTCPILRYLQTRESGLVTITSSQVAVQEEDDAKYQRVFRIPITSGGGDFIAITSASRQAIGTDYQTFDT